MQSGYKHHGLGNFGKSKAVVAPSPSSTAASAADDEDDEDDDEDEIEVPAAQAAPVIKAIKAASSVDDDESGDSDEELKIMKKMLAAKRQAAQAQMSEKLRQYQAHKEKLAKQYKYGRDTEQKKPKGAAYTTEAEKLMGAQTGYMGLGATELDVSTKKLNIATAALQAVQIAFNQGLASKAQLQKAIKAVETEASKNEKLQKQLGGLGEQSSLKPVIAVAVIGFLAYYLLIPR